MRAKLTIAAGAAAGVLMAVAGCGDGGGPVSGGLQAVGAASSAASTAAPTATATAAASPPAGATGTASPKPGRTSAKPATKAPSPAAAPTGPRIVEASITLDSPFYGGYCYDEGIAVTMRFVIRLDATAPPRTGVSAQVMSTDGVIFGSGISLVAENGVFDSPAFARVKWDRAKPERTVEFWVQTSSPNAVQSKRVSFKYSCRVS